QGARVLVLLQRRALAHGRAEDAQGVVLGREHAARLHVERDDDRDRQRPETGSVVWPPCQGSRSSVPATSASSPAPASPSSGTKSPSETSSPRRSTRCAAARFRSTSPGSTSCSRGTRTA